MKTRPDALFSLCTAGILLALSGCAKDRFVEIPVPFAIACQEKEPERPVMPTDNIKAGAGLDAKVQAALAEIERRDGYEVELVTALRACIKPIVGGTPSK